MLDRDKAVLILIDVQEKLTAVVAERDALVANLCKLVQGMRALDVPVIWLEQNPDGLGPTVPELKEHLSGLRPITKLSFSCWGEAPFRAALEGLGRQQALLCGIEAHVCVNQTALDLLAQGYRVQVVEDAVSSRVLSNKEAALAKLRAAGAVVTTTEMAFFELLRVAEGPAFKAILKIVK